VALLASNSSPSFALRRGTVVVDEKIADPVQVALPGARVLVKGDTESGAECEMVAEGNTSTITVKRGTAEIHGMGAPVLLHAGQFARVEAGPQGGSPVAGKISRQIPQGVIQRQVQIQELPLKVNDPVNWNDQVRTLEAGRAQIMLLDGSVLNVGARSTLKILKHDPQAQQTEIELALGKVQANVQKITAPGGKFELHTKSAIIGTIDTEYVAQSTGDSTTVCGVDGTTSVRSSDPNIPKTVTLKKNECTTVVFGFAPTDPVFAPGEVASMLGQTAVTGGAAGAGAVGGTLLVGVAGAAGTAIGLVVGEVALTIPTPTSPTVP
jgi:ferric-dicitrate binding protein FerR (iron transport regulator)